MRVPHLHFVIIWPALRASREPVAIRAECSNGMHYERLEWFPDGQRILFTGNEPNRPPRTFAQNVKDGKIAPITPEGMTAVLVSPDQKYLIVTQGNKLNLFPIAGGALKPVCNLGGCPSNPQVGGYEWIGTGT